MAYTKEEAVKIITNCAKTYDKELNNRNLLFVCSDKHSCLYYFEVSFHSFNFLHLTGVKISGINSVEQNRNNADSFYQDCLEGQLSPNDFKFSDTGTTQLKLEVLPLVINKNLSANMVGEFNDSGLKLHTEKLIGGVKACIGFVFNKSVQQYVPNTVLEGDIRDKVLDYARIIVTYRKLIEDKQYSEIVYTAKKIDWSKINFLKEYSYLPKPN